MPASAWCRYTADAMPTWCRHHAGMMPASCRHLKLFIGEVASKDAELGKIKIKLPEALNVRKNVYLFDHVSSETKGGICQQKVLTSHPAFGESERGGSQQLVDDCRPSAQGWETNCYGFLLSFDPSAPWFAVASLRPSCLCRGDQAFCSRRSCA